jgi:hypothetical protein
MVVADTRRTRPSYGPTKVMGEDRWARAERPVS